MSGAVTPASPLPPTSAPCRMSPSCTSLSECGNGSGRSKHTFDDREDGGCGADSEREHQHGGGGESGRLQQMANCDPKVMERHRHPRKRTELSLREHLSIQVPVLHKCLVARYLRDEKWGSHSRKRPNSETRCPRVDTALAQLFNRTARDNRVQFARREPLLLFLPLGRFWRRFMGRLLRRLCCGLRGLGLGFGGLGFLGRFRWRLCRRSCRRSRRCHYHGGGLALLAFWAGLCRRDAAAGASAAALAARPRLGAGGGGGGGGANGFKNFSVSVRERSLPSSNSMNTSCASFGYSGNCGVISNSVISGNGIFCCTCRHLVR